MRLLFEIGMEELPARFLVSTLKDLKSNLTKKFNDERIKFEKINTYGTPRRLVLDVLGLAPMQEDLDILNMGPAKSVAYGENGELSRAGMGFAKSQNLDPSELEIIETPKGEYIAARKFIKGQETKVLLPEILKNLVLEVNFPKSMKWADKKLKFARPIKWFVAMLDKDIIEFEIEGIKSSNISRGHRFFGNEFEINEASEYFDKIRENNVIIDIDERKNMIVSMINENCTGENEKVLINPKLLDEVTNLIEYPYPIVGTFNADFLEVPQDVLIISMEVHQRYFPILDENGKLLPKFVVVRNGIEDSDYVRTGNEKVLSARLADARFFYQEDLKKPLIENVEKLKHVVFQKDMGTIYEKLERTQNIANYLINAIGCLDHKDDIERTIYLAKADLVSNMIGEKEFTKLQGFMGADYALKSGENERVAKGIEEHYYPRFQGDKLPSSLEGIVAGIADRTDTLVGCFAVGVIPSGSKDPFALRRAALGIVNIIINSNIFVSLSSLVNVALDSLEETNVLKRDRNEVYNEVMEFLKQRAINVFSDMKYSKDIVLAVVNRNFDNLIDTKERIITISNAIKNPEFDELLAIVKRVGNILKDHKGNDVNPELFKLSIESELYSKAIELEQMTNKDIKDKDYTKYLSDILSVKDIINKYFEEVKVMDNDEDIKNNRLSELKYLSEIFGKIADLTSIGA